MNLDDIITAHGSEITWEVYVGESSYVVWALHNGENEDDSFKFCAAWSDLGTAARDVSDQIQHRGPKWARRG